MPKNISLTQLEAQTLADLGLNPTSNNLKQEIIQKIEELETKIAPSKARLSHSFKSLG